MFIAVRDLRFARGRFALLGGVIALMTLMVVLLTGLTAGLGAASISAVQELPVDRIAFQEPAAGQDISFATSTLSADTVDELEAAGADHAYPLGVSTSRVDIGDSSAAVTMLGADPRLHPEIESGQEPGGGEIAVTADLAEDNAVAVGDTADIAGSTAEVSAIVEETAFNHLPVVYLPLDDWKDVSHRTEASAVALTGMSEMDNVAGTRVVSRDDAFDAVGGYASEQGSLNLMRGLLLGVSALIVGAFFTVWTMQRGPDLAVARAIGARRGYLLRDALAQAGIVLVAGTAVGAAVAAGLGALAATVMPFVLDTTTLAIPVAAMIGTGALGAVFAVRRVSAVDPITALGAAR
ncbi:MAG: ABC transporter permease [Stackebrandtia sp.]